MATVLNVVSDYPAMSSHYADEANVGKLWNATGTKVNMKLPRMAVVSLALILFLLEQLRLRNKLYGNLAEK